MPLLQACDGAVRSMSGDDCDANEKNGGRDYTAGFLLEVPQVRLPVEAFTDIDVYPCNLN